MENDTKTPSILVTYRIGPFAKAARFQLTPEEAASITKYLSEPGCASGVTEDVVEMLIDGDLDGE